MNLGVLWCVHASNCLKFPLHLQFNKARLFIALKYHEDPNKWYMSKATLGGLIAKGTTFYSKDDDIRGL